LKVDDYVTGNSASIVLLLRRPASCRIRSVILFSTKNDFLKSEGCEQMAFSFGEGRDEAEHYSAMNRANKFSKQKMTFRKVRAVYRWPSPLEKVGMRLYEQNT